MIAPRHDDHVDTGRRGVDALLRSITDADNIGDALIRRRGVAILRSLYRGDRCLRVFSDDSVLNVVRMADIARGDKAIHRAIAVRQGRQAMIG